MHKQNFGSSKNLREKQANVAKVTESSIHQFIVQFQIVSVPSFGPLENQGSSSSATSTFSNEFIYSYKSTVCITSSLYLTGSFHQLPQNSGGKLLTSPSSSINTTLHAKGDQYLAFLWCQQKFCVACMLNFYIYIHMRHAPSARYLCKWMLVLPPITLINAI